MSVVVFPLSWNDQGTSIRLDVVCLIFALALHSPLFFVKFDSRKKTILGPKTRLVSIDLIDPSIPKPLPPPVAKKKSGGLMARLKKLMAKKPPPPPKPVKKLEPKKLDMAPKEIRLDPKLNAKLNETPKLKTKSGFKTKADPNLVKKQQDALKAGGPGFTPLTSKKMGTLKAGQSVKKSKGNFQVSKSEALTGIGGKGAGLADPSAPTIAIKTGKKGTTEKFAAATPGQKSSKGSFKGGQAAGLGATQNLGLRDAVIARNQAPIATGKSSGGSYGGGAVAVKKDAGKSFDSDQAGGLAQKPGVGLNAGKTVKSVPAIQPKKKKKKKKMFTITGPLKDRKIVNRVIPIYPDWAQAQGIEAAVVLQFTVLPNGKVKNSIVVRRTSGYPQLDDSAIKALKKWKFVPLPDDPNREEVGLITFNYTLN